MNEEGGGGPSRSKEEELELLVDITRARLDDQSHLHEKRARFIRQQQKSKVMFGENSEIRSRHNKEGSKVRHNGQPRKKLEFNLKMPKATDSEDSIDHVSQHDT